MNNTVKIPMHIILDFGSRNEAKLLAFFLSLKKVYSSGHIHSYKAFKKLNLGYKISQKTYRKYLNRLQAYRLVVSDNNGGIRCVGQDRLLELYPPAENNLVYLRLENNEKLKDILEYKCLENINNAQKSKIAKNSRNNVMAQNIQKGVCGSFNNAIVVLESEVSINGQKEAKIYGCKHRNSAYRRRRKFRVMDLIKTTHRRILLGKLDKEIVKGCRSNGWTLFNRKGNWYRILADEITIINETLGKLKIAKPKEVGVNFAELFGQF